MWSNILKCSRSQRLKYANQHFLQESTWEDKYAFQQRNTKHWTTTHFTFNQEKYTSNIFKEVKDFCLLTQFYNNFIGNELC